MARALSNIVYLESPEKGVDGRGILSGARDPLMTDGRLGDFWINTVSKHLFGPKNAGEWPDKGLIRGAQGWAPKLVAQADGTRRVFKIDDWTGGEGAKPGTGYLAADGTVVADIADAADFRGEQGPEALINALSTKSDEVTYDTLMAMAESAGDNEKAAIKRLFEAGGTMSFRAQTDAQGATIPAAVKRTVIGGVNYARTAAEPPHSLKYRSADRWTDEGAHDSANGGWWENIDPTLTASVSGATGIGDQALTLQKAVRTGRATVLDRDEYRTSAFQLPSGRVVELRGARSDDGKPIIKAASAGAKQAYLITRDTTLFTNTVKGVVMKDIVFDGEHVRQKGGFPYTDYSANDYGAMSAFQFTADIDEPNTVAVFVDCEWRNFPSFPFQLYGFKYVYLVRPRFSRCKDPGFVNCENVYVDDVDAEYSADNGLSVSRGVRRFVVKGGLIRDSSIAGLWISGFNITNPGTVSLSGPSYTPLSVLSVTASDNVFGQAHKGSTIVARDAGGNECIVKLVDILSLTSAVGIALTQVPAGLENVPSTSWYHAPMNGPQEGVAGGLTIVGSQAAHLYMQHAPKNITIAPNTLIRAGMTADSEVVATGSIAAGSSQLTLDDAAHFAVNDYVIVQPVTSMQDYWIGRIQSKAGNVLTMTGAAPRTYAQEEVRLLHLSALDGYVAFITGNGRGEHKYAENIDIQPQNIIDYRGVAFYLGSTSTAQGSVRRIRLGRSILSQPSGLGATGVGRSIIAVREQAGTKSDDVLVPDGMDVLDDTVPFFQAYQRGTDKRRWLINNVYAPSIAGSVFASVNDLDNGNASITDRYQFDRIGADGVKRATAHKFEGWKTGTIVSGVVDVTGYAMSFTPNAANVDVTDFSSSLLDGSGLSEFVVRNNHGSNTITLKNDINKIRTGTGADLVVGPYKMVKLMFLNANVVGVVG